MPKYSGEEGFSRVIVDNENHVHFLTNEIAYAYGYPYYSNRYNNLLCAGSNPYTVLQMFYEGTPQYDMRIKSCVVCNICRSIVQKYKIGIHLME